MDFDLPNAAPPQLLPLRESFDPGDYRDQIKQFALDLFEQHLGTAAFDGNVLGMAHLGSFDLVRRAIQSDRLGVLRSEREEAATRYLYRAWKAQDTQGRGLHFLRTYLDLLFPNQAELVQLWHDSRFPYGDALLRNEPRIIWRHFLGEPGLKIDGTWRLGQRLDEPYTHIPDESVLWLTSRIQIRLSLEYIASAPFTVGGRSAVRHLYPIIESVIPARLVPIFLFWLRFELFARPRIDYRFDLRKHADLCYPWCGRIISDVPCRRWSLGRDGVLVTLPQPFGTFRLGERRGGLSVWRLKSCRIVSDARLSKQAETIIYRLPMLGEPWRRLNGTWALGRRQSEAFGWGVLRQRAPVNAAPDLRTRFVENIRLDYPFTPRKLDRHRTLDGLWRLREDRPMQLARPLWGRHLDGFRLGRKPSIPAFGSITPKQHIQLYVAPRQLAPGLRLNGWPIGPLRPPEIRLTVKGQYPIAATQTIDSSRALRQHAYIRYPGYPAPQRIGRWRPLDGRWRLRAGEALPTLLRGSQLGRFSLGKPGPQILPRQLQLNGHWSLSGGRHLGAPMRRHLVLDGRPLISPHKTAIHSRFAISLNAEIRQEITAS
jgi:hypothetical protein